LRLVVGAWFGWQSVAQLGSCRCTVLFTLTLLHMHVHCCQQHCLYVCYTQLTCLQHLRWQAAPALALRRLQMHSSSVVVVGGTCYGAATRTSTALCKTCGEALLVYGSLTVVKYSNGVAGLCYNLFLDSIRSDVQVQRLPACGHNSWMPQRLSCTCVFPEQRVQCARLLWQAQQSMQSITGCSCVTLTGYGQMLVSDAATSVRMTVFGQHLIAIRSCVVVLHITLCGWNRHFHG
jgi:hypothetical protein